MNLFRSIWPSGDGPPNSTSTPMASNQLTSDAPGGGSGGALSRLTGHRRSQSQSQSQSQPRPDATQSHPPNQRRDRAPQYSPYSTQGPFNTRMFFSENFMLGAGAVIIQPSSGKVVIVQDGDYWFLPKGRKDLGESIEQAALREAYEEVCVSLSLNLPRYDFDPWSPVRLPVRIPAALPLDERPRRVTSGARTETHRTPIRHHYFICSPPEQAAWGILNLLVRLSDRA